MKLNLLLKKYWRSTVGLTGMLSFIIQVHSQAPEQDSVTVPASKKYNNFSPLRLLFNGKNYRREWSTPVKMPVFDLKKYKGGFTIKELGGGQQTKSLRLVDKEGEEWVLRTTDKDVSKALELGLKNKVASSLVKNIVQDLISASHPYGSLTVPDLAKAAGVIVARPQLFYVPDDPAFGEFQKIFANTVCFLEDREPTPDQSETESTIDVMKKVFEENDHLLLQQSILKARLLDMLIADWDRHEDQWKWGIRKKDDNTYYYPVPKDRDFAYFKSNGLIILFASLTAMPHMHSFTDDGSALKKLSNKTWEMDAQWLNQLDAEDWKKTISNFQSQLTDSVIENAVKNLPREIYAISGRDLTQKLKARRNGLLEHGLRYFEFLAMNAYVFGTDDKEHFKVNAEGKNISITVSRRGGDDKDQTIYHRTFLANETNKVYVMGLGGDDRFEIDEKVSSSIKLEFQGGKGDDAYGVKGKIKVKIEDNTNKNKTAVAQKR